MNHHHGRGNIKIGRMFVAGGTLAVLGTNALVYKEAMVTAYPVPGVPVAMITGMMWMIAGAGGWCMRRPWGRFMSLTILTAGCFGLFVTGVVTVANAQGAVAKQGELAFVATAVYLVVTLVLAKSKNVRRLTSRTWE